MLSCSLALFEPLTLATTLPTQARLAQRICQASTNEAALRAVSNADLKVMAQNPQEQHKHSDIRHSQHWASSVPRLA